MRSVGIGGQGKYRASKDRISARSAFGIAWLFSLFFFLQLQARQHPALL